MEGAPAEARAQVFEGPDLGLRYQTLALPERLGPGEVLVQIELATICGSDLHTIAGHRREPVPAVLGHEAVGRVIAAEGRPDLQPGDRVSWTIADSCGQCQPCDRCRRRSCTRCPASSQACFSTLWQTKTGSFS